MKETAAGGGSVQRGSLAAALAVACGVVVAAVGTRAQSGEVSLRGVIDLHAHSGPDSRPRSVTDLQVATKAEDAGMRGVVLKNHFTLTSDRAALVMEETDGLEVFGGVALNRAVGGINPEAVREMAAFSGGRGKIVWLPTVDAHYWVTRNQTSRPFVAVIEGGVPVAGLREVFEIVAEHDLVLATGHSAAEESLQLIPVARRLGVERILVTHVLLQNATTDQMRAMASWGAMMELSWLQVHSGALRIEAYARVVRDIGAEHFVMSTDLGQVGNPDHIDGMRAFIAAMRDAGVSGEDVHRMTRDNPARLLGLD